MSKKESVNVTIDSNEASQKPELVETLALHEDVEDYKIEPKSEGDVHIDNCMFERKSPSDFASSLQDGRLRDQVERMAGNDKIPFVMVDGDMSDFEELGYTIIGPKSLRGMVASIEMKNNVRVKFCSDIKTLCDMTVRLSRKEKEEVELTQARQTDAIKTPSFIEEVFLAIDGVGVKTAEKLASEFNSLQKALNATKDDFKEVDDVGDVTADKIYNCLNGNVNGKSDTGKRVYNL